MLIAMPLKNTNYTVHHAEEEYSLVLMGCSSAGEGRSVIGSESGAGGSTDLAATNEKTICTEAYCSILGLE